MSNRTYVEQGQIAATYDTDVDDRLPIVDPGRESSLLADLNLIRTQIRKVIKMDGHWLDEPQLTLDDLNIALSSGNTLNAGSIAAEGLSITQAGTTLNLSNPQDTAAYANLFGSSTIVGSLNELLAESYAFYRKGYLMGDAVDASGMLNFSAIGSLRSGWDSDRDISVYLNGVLLFTNDYTVIDAQTIQFVGITLRNDDIIGIVLPNSDGSPTGMTYVPPPSVNLTGDVIGDSIASTVAKIRNRNVSAQAPNQGDIYAWDSGTSAWIPKQLPVSFSIFGAENLTTGMTPQYLIPGTGGVGNASSLPIAFPCPFTGSITGIKAYHALPNPDYEITYTIKNGAGSVALCVVPANESASTLESVIIDSPVISVGDPISVTCSYAADLSLTVGVTLVISIQQA